MKPSNPKYPSLVRSTLWACHEEFPALSGVIDPFPVYWDAPGGSSLHVVRPVDERANGRANDLVRARQVSFTPTKPASSRSNERLTSDTLQQCGHINLGRKGSDDHLTMATALREVQEALGNETSPVLTAGVDQALEPTQGGVSLTDDRKLYSSLGNLKPNSQVR